MTKYISTQHGKVRCLDTEAVIQLHELLSNNIHLLEQMDPVEPKGVKNFGLLESAVNRQFTGLAEYYKYPDCFSNVATLVYGVIKNHAFHNGNKRAGLLVLIKHLYLNGYVLNPGLKSDEIYDIVVAIADTKLKAFFHRNKQKYTFIQNKEEKEKPWSIDTKIRFIAFWIKKNSCPKAHTIKGDVKISVLRNVLTNKGVKLVQKGCHIEVFTEKENKFLGIFPRKTTLMKKTYTLGNNRTCINRETLNALRKDFNLTLSDGIDDTFFYDDDAFLDSEIKTYKKIIYQLSKT